MKLVLTLLVRNEADIVDANLAYHLNRGVDFVVATDNNSDDGTLDVLAEHRRAGHLQLIQEPAGDYAQSDWISRMAHVAATEHGADWIIHADADEFWWPRESTLKDVFASVPERYGIFEGHRFDFLPRPDESGFFADRMTTRLRLPDKVKVAHKPDPDAVVGQGSHRLDRTSLALAPPWHAVDVLHFPLRRYDQFEQKVRMAGAGTGVKHWRNAHGLLERGELRAAWDALLLSDETIKAIEAGRQPEPSEVLVGRSSKRPHGGLVRDERLRDYLRELRTPDGFSVEPRPESDAVIDPEAAIVMEIVERRLEEALKSYVRAAKEDVRAVRRSRDEAKTRYTQMKKRLAELREQNMQLREELARATERPMAGLRRLLGRS